MTTFNGYCGDKGESSQQSTDKPCSSNCKDKELAEMAGRPNFPHIR